MVPMRKSRGGIAAVELALVLPLLMILLVGTWEIGRLIEVTNIVSNAAREGARAAATAEKTADESKQAALNYMRNNGLDVTNAVVTVTTASGGDPKDASQLDKVGVTVQLPFKDNAWAMLDFFVSSNRKVTATAEWRSMADVPITVNSNLPIE